MQRLVRIGVIACALVLIGTTARADPFTFRDHRAAAGVGAAWFNNLIKIDEAFYGGGAQLFLTNATITFGGQSITVPSATISFSSPAATGGAYSPDHFFGAPGHGSSGGNFLLAGGFGGASGGSSSQGVSGTQQSGTPGFTSQVPGAGAAYNPFNPDLGNGNSGTGVNTGRLGTTFQIQLANGTARITAASAALTAAAVPTTPEPSPLLLLATGLAVFFLWKKRDALKSSLA